MTRRDVIKRAVGGVLAGLFGRSINPVPAKSWPVDAVNDHFRYQTSFSNPATTSLHCQHYGPGVDGNWSLSY